jgi:hypothetical protein
MTTVHAAVSEAPVAPSELAEAASDREAGIRASSERDR